MILAVSEIIASFLGVCKPSGGCTLTGNVNHPLWNQPVDVDTGHKHAVGNVIALGILVRLSNNTHNVTVCPDPPLSVRHPLVFDWLHVCAHHVFLRKIMPQLHFHQKVSVTRHRWSLEGIIRLAIVHVFCLIHDAKVKENRFPLLANVHVHYHITQVIEVNLQRCSSFQHQHR